MGERIVVGVDGSITARLATRWAAQEARFRGAKLELVSAWDMPSYTYGFGYAVVTDELLKDLAGGAEGNLATAAQEARAEAADVEVQTSAVRGQAARVLLDTSKDAVLLVVGSRGLGGFRELLLGSVSQQCAHYSTCPVVIVRHMHEVA